MSSSGRAVQLDEVLASLLRESPEVDAAAVVSYDGLPMASALPAEMDETRVAAMSAALLSLGERAAEGLGRGDLSQVYIEGATGTVFLVSADGEAVLVAVAGAAAKAGLVLYELRRSAVRIGAVLRAEAASEAPPTSGPAPSAPSSPDPLPEQMSYEPIAAAPAAGDLLPDWSTAPADGAPSWP